MKRNFLLVVLVISLLTAGCAPVLDFQSGITETGLEDKTDQMKQDSLETQKTSKTDMNDKDGITEQNDAETQQDSEKQSTDGGAEDEVSPGEIQTEFARANLEFSWDLFKMLNEQDAKKNIFISPYSISSALMMVLNGAEGNTRIEMEEMLYYSGITREQLNRAYANGAIQSSDKKVKLQNANSIWIRSGFNVKQDFIDRNARYLDAEVRTLNFADKSAADTINAWVSEKTNRLIPSIITTPIPNNVMMYLINAIYFKGEWATPFDEEQTHETNFYALDGKTDNVFMMRRKGYIAYFGNEDVKAVRLPYGDGRISMILVLPLKEDINKWIGSMNTEKWEEITKGFFHGITVDLQIPRFKMEYGMMELNGALKALGMKEAFTNRADLSGIAENILISGVFHKALVDVNEQGTEAAAVTSVVIVPTSYVEPVSFIADRPFFFAIVDNETGNLLFMGKKITGEKD